ncbi:hypothetical protein NDA17_006912 [Ustilago hordei]|nr:hypothetical protein NDA17_006912 [Ustilago hordei]
MDGDKPNASDYNCIEDTYDTSKSMTSKALCSTHEMYGDGEMDPHLYTDVATMDKPCEPCLQATIGGAIKTFVDAKDMDTYARRERLGVTTAITSFNLSAARRSSLIATSPTTGVPGYQIHDTLNASKAAAHFAAPTKDLEISAQDDMHYCLAHLATNLKALVIQDPKTDMSRVTMDIHVGHLSDLEELQGIAQFYISPDHLKSALDRFTQSFLEHLFKSSCSEQETKAVDRDHKFTPFDSVSKRITTEVEKNGKQYIATKSATNTILKPCTPDAKTATQYQKVTDSFTLRGFGLLSISMNTDGQWKLLDLVPVFDPPCSDIATIITKAQLLNTSVQMITGDAITIDKETCKMLQHRVHLAVITGDNVNDAPPLKKDGKQYIAAKDASNAILKQLIGAICKSAGVEGKIANDEAKGFIKHAECLKLIHGQNLTIITVS